MKIQLKSVENKKDIIRHISVLHNQCGGWQSSTNEEYVVAAS